MLRYFIFSVLLLLSQQSIWSQDDSCACCTEQHMAFDFWIGDWEVTDSEGKVVGTNSISKAQDGCVLVEEWKSSNGTFTGGSTSFLNRLSGEWEQLWIDNGGSHLHLKGKREANQMILVSDEIPREEKAAYRNRIIWTLNQDGTVRQLWEVLVGEQVESVVFDGLYNKK